jgi:hypothetical protein
MTQIEFIKQLEEDVQMMISEISKEFTSLTDADLNFKESNNRWSVLECLEHLCRYNRFYNTEIKNALGKARKVPGAPLKSSWLGSKSIAMMHPDNTKRQKTVSHMNPVNSVLNRSLLDEFLKHQDELLSLLHQCRLVNLNTGRVRIEFFRLLTFPIHEALQFLVVHQQRHMKQLKQIKATLTKSEPVLKV